VRRPRVTLKLATSLDGRIATGSGESRWITGEAARDQVHRLRIMHMGVLVGIETVIADDPELNVRIPGFIGAGPRAIILDSRQRISSEAKLVLGAEYRRTIVVSTITPQARLTEAGVQVLTVPAADRRVDPAAALEALFREQILSVMIEGGGQVAASFLAADLVDGIEWFRAPILLGDEGRPAVGDLAIEALAEAPRFRRVDVQPLGDDLWERYERQT
jgi:diaminohydroxyphosphoribosylaminopyrimidine deaminase/5-amino-6-(5-phosphoribosylamino)uracil reductase